MEKIKKILSQDDLEKAKELDRRKNESNEQKKFESQRKNPDRRVKNNGARQFWLITGGWFLVFIVFTLTIIIVPKDPGKSRESFALIFYLFSIILFLGLGIFYNKTKVRRKSDIHNYFEFVNSFFAFLCFLAFSFFYYLGVF